MLFKIICLVNLFVSIAYSSRYIRPVRTWGCQDERDVLAFPERTLNPMRSPVSLINYFKLVLLQVNQYITAFIIITV